MAEKQPRVVDRFSFNPVKFRSLLPVHSAGRTRLTEKDRERWPNWDQADSARKKNSRGGSLQNVSSCFWPDPGMEIAALYKAELIWEQLETVKKYGSSYSTCLKRASLLKFHITFFYYYLTNTCLYLQSFLMQITSQLTRIFCLYTISTHKIS